MPGRRCRTSVRAAMKERISVRMRQRIFVQRRHSCTFDHSGDVAILAPILNATIRNLTR